MTHSNGQRAKKQDLLYYHQLPPVLQYNRFILSGYRAGYSYAAAVFSIFHLHNETGNIWTHLIPACILLSDLWLNEATEGWLYTVHRLSALICFVASVSYHTCMACHRHYHTWIKMDICGVYGLLLGSQLHLFYFAMPCHPSWRWGITCVYLVMGAVSLMSSLKAESRMGRGVPMIALVVIRVTALMMRRIVGSPNLHAWRLYASAEAISFLGGTLNALHVPERWAWRRRLPGELHDAGSFDYWLNSHQIMHVLVAIAIFIMRHGLNSDCHYARTHTLCPM